MTSGQVSSAVAMKLNMIVVMTRWLPRRACNTSRDKSPGGAEAGSGDDRHGEDETCRHIAECQDHQRGTEAAQCRLALATDVEQTGLERQCYGKPRDHIVGRIEQGVADALEIAERAAQQGEERPTRVFADGQD